MGFTPLEGLMMGSRSGSIDPGLLLHLLRQPNYSVDRLDRILNQESGLEGISGLSSDLREILPKAMLARNSLLTPMCIACDPTLVQCWLAWAGWMRWSLRRE